VNSVRGVGRGIDDFSSDREAPPLVVLT